MLPETLSTPVVFITCSSCPATISATEKSRERAISMREAGDSPARVEGHAARLAARDVDWAVDYGSRPNPGWLCPACATRVKAERTSPCPAWCGSCQGYDFWSEGTWHCRSWLSEAGDLLAEVGQHVSADGVVEWTSARLYDVAEDFTSLDDLLAVAKLVDEVATFVQANGLVLDGGE